MKSKRMWSFAALAACGLLVAGTAFAQTGEGPGRRERGQRAGQGQRQERRAERMGGEGEMGHHRPRHGMRILRALDLTPEQREAIKAIHENYKPQIQAAHENLVQQRKALRDAVKATPVNEGAIRSAANQVGSGIGDLAILLANRRAEVRAVLTAEQQDQFDQAVDDLPELGGGLGRGGRRGGPAAADEAL